MRRAWAFLICIGPASAAAASGVGGVRFDANVEPSSGDHVGGGWASDLSSGGAIDGLAFSLESGGVADDGLFVDGTLETGDGVTVTMGGGGATDGGRTAAVPLPSGAALALAGLACAGLRRTRRVE